MRRIEATGVELALIAGVDVSSSELEILNAKRFSVLKVCVGVHPWNADLLSKETLHRLKEIASNKEVAAFSEIGLDFFSRRNREKNVFENKHIDEQVQRTAFSEQLRAAMELNLPVIIHDRVPEYEVHNILEEEGNAKVGAAIHGFDKNLAYAKRCIGMSVNISIGFAIPDPETLVGVSPPQSPLAAPVQPGSPAQPQPSTTQPNAKAIRAHIVEVVRQTDIKWLLTDTDRINPDGVLAIAEKIAEIKCMTRDDVGRETTKNLRKLLRL